jgi:hypothetical protein
VDTNSKIGRRSSGGGSANQLALSFERNSSTGRGDCLACLIGQIVQDQVKYQFR